MGILHVLLVTFSYLYFKLFNSSRTFLFHGNTYKYFIHTYNPTWRKERAVEIPIILEVVNRYKGKNILEVGNVLANYLPINHDVLDKYEKTDNVINQDVVNFQPKKKYDLIISISTLEHVGWDEEPREPKKILRAIKNLRSLLVPSGKIVITLPLGHNTEMDKLIKNGKVHFNEVHYLKRISRDNKWIETNWEGVKNVKYGSPYICANGLVIGTIKK